MRRLKLFRIERVSDDVRMVLEDWAGILFAIGVGLLLFATLKAQLARAASPDVYQISSVSPRVPMDRDFLIAWRPSVGSSPAVAALTVTCGDTTHAQHSLPQRYVS
jgi:hypothetical protein